MAQNKILILFAHPLFEKSHAHKALVENIPDTDDITFHDLYELYPEFNIDIKKEQELLDNHNIIIWQHPMYWYSCPPMIKQWIDLVLEYKWPMALKAISWKVNLFFRQLQQVDERTTIVKPVAIVLRYMSC